MNLAEGNSRRRTRQATLKTMELAQSAPEKCGRPPTEPVWERRTTGRYCHFTCRQNWGNRLLRLHL